VSLWAAQSLAAVYAHRPALSSAHCSALNSAHCLALNIAHYLALFVRISDCNVTGGSFWSCGMGPRRGASIDQPGLSLRGKSGTDKRSG
jgi:hypothetical protein